jgi:acetyl-CoA decarbonylase/synthase complex subunit gamma
MLQINNGDKMKIRSVRKVSKPEKPLSDCCCPQSTEADKPPCCGPAMTVRGGKISEKVPGFLGWLATAAGRVPQIAGGLTMKDRLGSWQARWGIGRMNYIVPPGLYAIGSPGEDDPVVVTANYKMTYDLVRQSLAGRSVWLLVLETFGVNVWCAAGKGTFGTDELVRRINESRLAMVVRHRRLLLPILGAPGVAAHTVKQRSGFTIAYATIRAADLPAFLDNGQQTTPAMRELTFTLGERLVLVPVEIVFSLKSSAVIALALLLSGSLLEGATAGLTAATAYLGAMLTGLVIGPLLLPWLPGRSFALKGAIAGAGWTAALCFFTGGWNPFVTVAAFFALPAASSYYTLNFTGCSTYTSRSGVKKEMRLGLPLMAGAVAVSILLLLAGRLI